MPPAGLRSRKTAHRRGVAEWLDPGVRQLDKNHCEAVRRQRARLRDASTKHQPMEPARRREIGQDDCRVVEPSDHRRSPQIEGSLRPEVEVGGSPASRCYEDRAQTCALARTWRASQVRAAVNI